MPRRRMRPMRLDNEDVVPSYDVDEDGALSSTPFAEGDVRTVLGPIAARFSNWDTIVADLEIAAASLDRFFTVREAFLQPGPMAWREEQEQRHQLVRLWTTAVTFFFRCYNPSGKRRYYLVPEDFPEVGHYNVIRVVKDHRDKAIHHSVNASDAAAVGVTFRDGRVAAVITASNRRFFPDPALPHAELFKNVVDIGLRVARSRLYWAEWDLYEHANGLSSEERAKLPDGIKLLDPGLGWGHLPREEDGRAVDAAAQRKSGYLNPVRLFRVPGFMGYTEERGIALSVDPKAEIAVVRLGDGKEHEIVCKASIVQDLVDALQSRTTVRVVCQRQQGSAKVEVRVRVAALEH